MESAINYLFQSPTSAEALRKVGMLKKRKNANYVFINSKFNKSHHALCTNTLQYSDNKEVPCIVTAPLF
jgi:predicted N-acyltransferase